MPLCSISGQVDVGVSATFFFILAPLILVLRHCKGSTPHSSCFARLLAAEIVQHILTKGNRGSHLLQTLPDRGGFIAGFQIPDGKVRTCFLAARHLWENKGWRRRREERTGQDAVIAFACYCCLAAVKRVCL
eukprot:1160948-Pelagomonas_calceolata.AAC.5